MGILNDLIHGGSSGADVAQSYDDDSRASPHEDRNILYDSITTGTQYDRSTTADQNISDRRTSGEERAERQEPSAPKSLPVKNNIVYAESSRNLEKALNNLNVAKNNLGYVTDPFSEALARQDLNDAQKAYDDAKAAFDSLSESMQSEQPSVSETMPAQKRESQVGDSLSRALADVQQRNNIFQDDLNQTMDQVQEANTPLAPTNVEGGTSFDDAKPWQKAWMLAKDIDRRAGNTFMTGVSGALASVAGEGTLGDEIWKIIGTTINSLGGNVDVNTNPISEWNRRRINAQQAYEEQSQEMTKNSPVASKVSKYGSMAWQQAPSAIGAILMAPVAAGTELGTAGLQYLSAINSAKGFQKFATMATNALGKLTSDPQFWMSYTQEAGNAYNSALAEGATPEEAGLYSTLYATSAAIIEIGGVDDALGGMQNFPKEVADGLKTGNAAKTALGFVKDIAGEIGEELQQGTVENVFKMTYRDVPLYVNPYSGKSLGWDIQEGQLYPGLKLIDTPEGTDANSAIINPQNIAETARDTAITTALLMGGQSAIMNGVNAAQSRNTDALADSLEERQAATRAAQQQSSQRAPAPAKPSSMELTDSGTGTSVAQQALLQAQPQARPLQQEETRMSGIERAEMAEPPAMRTPATPAQERVEEILDSDTVSSAEAEEIVESPVLTEAYEAVTGETLVGTETERINQIQERHESGETRAEREAPEGLRITTQEEATVPAPKPAPSPAKASQASNTVYTSENGNYSIVRNGSNGYNVVDAEGNTVGTGMSYTQAVETIRQKNASDTPAPHRQPQPVKAQSTTTNPLIQEERSTSGENRAENQAPPSPRVTETANPLVEQARRQSGEQRAEAQSPEAPQQTVETPRNILAETVRNESGEQRAEQQAPAEPRAQTETTTTPLVETEQRTSGEERAEQQAPEAPRAETEAQSEPETEAQTGTDETETDTEDELAGATYEELAQRYGIIEPGEKPTREANMPRRTAKGNKVSQGTRTVVEAGATPESRLADIQSAVAEGKFSYIPVKNTDRAMAARAKIQTKGWSKALRDWTAAVHEGRAGADLVAEGAVLINNAANNPECSGAEYIDLLTDYVKLTRNTAQGTQAARILKKLSPEGKLYSIEKTFESMNDEVAARDSKNPKKAEKRAEERREKNQQRSEVVQEAVKEAKEKAAKTVFTFEYSDEAAQMIARAVEAKAKPRTQRVKTLMENLVDTVKRFATERIPSQPSNSLRMTSTELLAELSNNEEFAREAYELAQQQVREDTRGTESEELASEFADSGLALTESGIVKRAVAESAVATNENRSTILNQSALGIGTNEIADTIANDLIARTQASEDISNAIREASLDYVQEVLGGETVETDERVDSLVRQVMSQIGEQFNNLAKSDGFTRQAALQAVQDTLTERYGVNGQSASEIADSILNSFDTRLNEAIQEELKKRFGKSDASTAIKRQLPNKLAEAINLGAFSSEYASQAINDIFRVDGQYYLDPALIDEYRQQTTDEGRDAVIERIQQSIADQVPSTLKDKFTALRYLNMLGNFKTQVRNILGNTGMMAVQKIKNSMRAGIETVKSASSDTYQKQYSTFYGRDLWNVSKSDITSNQDIMDETMGEKKFSAAGQQFASGVQDKVNPFKFGDNMLTRYFGIENTQGPLGKALSAYSDLTTKAMEEGDRFFITLNYADGLAGYLKAHNITAEQWKALVAEAQSDPTSDAAQTVDTARQFAIKQAQEATFRDTNAISEFAQNFDKNWKGAKVISQGIVPFRKTPADVAVRMFEYSPLGILNTAYKTVQAARGTNNVTGADIIDSLSKSLTGVGLAYLGFILAQHGRAKTKSDDDEQEAFDKLRGLQDYSITVGGNNFTLDWAVPAAAALFMGVEGYNLAIDGNITGDDFMRILGNLTAPMMEMSMLSGLNDALNNIAKFNDDTSATGQFFLNSAWSYLTQGFTNTLLGQLEQASEDYRQTYYTDPDSMVPTTLQRGLAKAGNKTPGKDYQAADYIDAWGRKQENFSNPLLRYAYALGSPSYITSLGEKSTPVDDELQRLNDYGKSKDRFPDVFPNTVSRNTTVNGTRLSAEEYDTYATTKGQESLRLVTELVGSRAYQSLSDDAKAEAISECYSYARYLAEKKIADERNEDYTSDYQELLTGVDKSGAAYDKTGLNASNFTNYIAIKTGVKDAVDKQDYKALDKLVADYNRQNANLKTVLSERNPVLRALTKWNDAGLDSKTYYDVQKALVSSQRKLDKSQKTGSAVELDALASVNLPEATKKRLIDSLDDYGSKTVKGVYDILYEYGFDSKTINKFWNDSQDWIYTDTGDPQSSQKQGTLQNDEAAYAIMQLPGLTDAQMTDIYYKLKEVAHNPYKINDWGTYSFSSEKNYVTSGRSKKTYGASKTGITSGAAGTSGTSGTSGNYLADLYGLPVQKKGESNSTGTNYLAESSKQSSSKKKTKSINSAEQFLRSIGIG